MKLKKGLNGVLAMLLLGWGQQALGLVLSCSASATPTNFGTYNPFSQAPLDTTGRVTVTCQDLVNIWVGYTIKLSAGSSSNYAARQMVGPGYQLQYNLYTDSGRTSVWGDGSGGSAVLSDSYLLAVLFPVERSYDIYGRITAGQNVPPGSYADTIVVTIDY